MLVQRLPDREGYASERTARRGEVQEMATLPGVSLGVDQVLGLEGGEGP